MSQRKKQRRIDYTECVKKEAPVLAYLLRESKKNDRTEPKRIGTSKFDAAFSFIPDFFRIAKRTDKENWRCHTFNGNRQYIEYFRTFICPYPVPEWLLFSTLQNESVINEKGRRVPSPNSAIIKLAKKWVCDFVSGESFYRKNKEYFTKAEAHYFLTSKMIYEDALSVIEAYFNAKCKARGFNQKLCSMISKVFTIRFSKYFNNTIVTGFLDLLARNKDYNLDKDELGDICDFVNDKIAKYLKRKGTVPPFSFSGRTMSSIIALTNEWHAEQQRVQEIQDMISDANNRQLHGAIFHKNNFLIQRWKGINIPDFSYEDNKCIWKFTQLRAVQDLFS
jgi:hypothetical protein